MPWAGIGSAILGSAGSLFGGSGSRTDKGQRALDVVTANRNYELSQDSMALNREAMDEARYQYRNQVDLGREYWQKEADIAERYRTEDWERLKQQRVWDEQRQDSQIQRTVADAKAAGIHPVYAMGAGASYGGGGAIGGGQGGPSGSSPVGAGSSGAGGSFAPLPDGGSGGVRYATTRGNAAAAADMMSAALSQVAQNKAQKQALDHELHMEALRAANQRETARMVQELAKENDVQRMAADSSRARTAQRVNAVRPTRAPGSGKHSYTLPDGKTRSYTSGEKSEDEIRSIVQELDEIRYDIVKSQKESFRRDMAKAKKLATEGWRKYTKWRSTRSSKGRNR